MWRRAGGALAVAILTAAGCSDGRPAAEAPTTTVDPLGEPADASGDVEPVDVAALEARAKVAAGQVVASGRTFVPPSVTISVGQAVAWRFEDGQVPHGVEGDGFRSSPRTQGVVVHTFPTAGTYRYRCPIHADMQGTVQVG